MTDKALGISENPEILIEKDRRLIVIAWMRKRFSDRLEFSDMQLMVPRHEKGMR